MHTPLLWTTHLLSFHSLLLVVDGFLTVVRLSLNA